jgi:transcriptional regulator with XRE-family HTH domain
MATAQDRTFGELVRRYRRDCGLTQEELAERATLSVQAALQRLSEIALPGK